MIVHDHEPANTRGTLSKRASVCLLLRDKARPGGDGKAVPSDLQGSATRSRVGTSWSGDVKLCGSHIRALLVCSRY